MDTYESYAHAVLSPLWDWADGNHAGELDGGPRVRRPPVLRPEFASKAVLVPPDPTRASGIVSAVPSKARHRQFGSLNSSQALAQSVFGALGVFGRLDVLDDGVAECGRPAFLEHTRSAPLVLEHKVRRLHERSPMNVDVLL